jgi:Domain of unknown function (DUF4145)
MAITDETPKAKIPKQVKGHCPNCGPQRYADVVGEHSVVESDDSSGVWAQTDYRMLSCGGCKKVYFQEIYIFSEDVDYDYHPITGEETREYNQKITFWPAPAKRKHPDWLSDILVRDRSLHEILLETYNTLDADARILAATGVRTALDRASELVGVDPVGTFDQKLTALVERGEIGSNERDHLAVLTNAGSAAAHRGWSPSLDELSTMMSVLESFIYRTFVLDNEVKRLKPSIPRRPRAKIKPPK